MAVGKEAIHVLEELRKAQVRIYPDACDEGIWETDANRAAIRGALEELKELEGGKAWSWSSGTGYKTRLGVGMDNGMVEGVEVEVSRCVDQRTRKAFYSICLTHSKWWPNSKVE